MANTMEDLKNAVATVWINDKKTDFESAIKSCELGEKDVADAEARLKRFAPVIMHYFPETEKTNGIIESPIKEIPSMKENMAENMSGRLFVKLDSHLAVAGSIKARGGIYEVLKHTEDLALENGIIDSTDDDYMKITTDEARKFFASRKIQVGSTGNLGMSIGIMSAALGYTAIVHMSVDAKQWKKDLLRSRGVTVIEYDGDYGKAVEQGRAISDKDEASYFVDDENSRNLFLGYAVAANRIGKQFEENNVVVDDNHPLFVYLPCGVGGGPGGVAFGLKLHYGDNVHCFFVEPTQAPCMLLGLATGKHNEICVQDIGLTGKTDADGLAVGRPSGFIGKFIEPFLSGEFTVEDGKLYDYLRLLVKSEDVFIEPSSCSAFQGVKMFAESEEMKKYIEDNNLSDKLENITQIAWATGGSLVPDEQRKYFLEKHI